MIKFLSENKIGKPQIFSIESAIGFFLLLLSVTSCSNAGAESKTIKKIDPKVESLKLQPGFEAEHLYSPSENDQGSWVAMAFDDKGRLITSDQYGALYRTKLSPIGSDQKPSVEKLIIGNQTKTDTTGLQSGMGYAHGLLYAFNSLYVMVNNNEGNEDFNKGSGFYRLQDTNGDDQFDKVTLLKSLKGSGEHGPHSIILSPDKKLLYVIAGNHTDLPEMNDYRLPPVWKYDNLFPPIKDPRGHANDRTAPGGWIAKTDSIGENWELVSAGYRNAFDIAFNEAGDLFAYDADMEWDFGMPWYRPTRIVHATSGSEFGWRTGNGKWPTVYPDNLPPVLNIGQGSPTSLVSGINAKFPEKYENSLFGFDWSFGIIYSIHLEQNGSSYSATGEEFLSGSPLPLTDGVIGPDGALYFLTGGRRLQSDLYRVYYNGEDARDNKVTSQGLKKSEAHQLREQLEEYHDGPEDGAVDFAWPYLGHEDRFVRYAARIALEHQPVNQWRERALGEQDPEILTSAIIALARHADKKLNNEMLRSLMRIKFEDLTSEQERLDLIRAVELVLFRHGKPAPAVQKDLLAYLDTLYPAESNNLNRSLSKVLVNLESSEVVSETLDLIENSENDDSQENMVTESADLILRNPQYGLDIAGMLAKTPPAQQVYLATVLGEANMGWTPELREKYFKWFHEAFSYKGGRSYVGFIDKARQKALSRVPKNELAHYNKISGDSLLSSSGNEIVDIAGPKGPGRSWTVDEALSYVRDSLKNRDFKRGKELFAATLCIQCHTMKGQGTSIGPDLTQLGNRFTRQDILESIIKPNEVISDQYASTEFYLKNGNSVVGRTINEDNSYYYVSQNPFAPQDLRKIAKENVVNKKASDVSMMLPGLINSLNPEELKDFMAYLISGGNVKHEVYGDTEAE